MDVENQSNGVAQLLEIMAQPTGGDAQSAIQDGHDQTSSDGSTHSDDWDK